MRVWNFLTGLPVGEILNNGLHIDPALGSDGVMGHTWNVDGIKDAELGVCAHRGSQVLLALTQSVELGVWAYVFLGAEGSRIITVAFGLLHLNYKHHTIGKKVTILLGVGC